MATIFEVVYTYRRNKDQFIIARLLTGNSDFNITEGTLLGGVPIHNELDMPRLMNDHQQPVLDVFIFRLIKLAESDMFFKGQKVELTTYRD